MSTYLSNGPVDQLGRVGRLGAGAGGNGRVAIAAAAAAVRGYGFAGGYIRRPSSCPAQVPRGAGPDEDAGAGTRGARLCLQSVWIAKDVHMITIERKLFRYLCCSTAYRQ